MALQLSLYSYFTLLFIVTFIMALQLSLYLYFTLLFNYGLLSYSMLLVVHTCQSVYRYCQGVSLPKYLG